MRKVITSLYSACFYFFLSFFFSLLWHFSFFSSLLLPAAFLYSSRLQWHTSLIASRESEWNTCERPITRDREVWVAREKVSECVKVRGHPMREKKKMILQKYFYSDQWGEDKWLSARATSLLRERVNVRCKISCEWCYSVKCALILCKHETVESSSFWCMQSKCGWHAMQIVAANSFSLSPCVYFTYRFTGEAKGDRAQKCIYLRDIVNWIAFSRVTWSFKLFALSLSLYGFFFGVWVTRSFAGTINTGQAGWPGASAVAFYRPSFSLCLCLCLCSA